MANSIAFRSATLQRRPLLETTPPGDDRDRTGDPLLAKQVLSQLSYAPVQLPVISFQLPETPWKLTTGH